MSEELDNFFARKDKKKKGAGDKKKGSKQNAKADNNNTDSHYGNNDGTEHEEWGTIEDDISKSVMAIEDALSQESGGTNTQSSKQSNEFQTITEEENGIGGDGSQSKASGPWKIQQEGEAEQKQMSDQSTLNNTLLSENHNSQKTAEVAPGALNSVSLPVPAQSSAAVAATSSSSAAPAKYVPRHLRNKTDSPGAQYNSSSIQKSSVLHKVDPPDVKSQSDFPTLMVAASSGDATSPSVPENAWGTQAPSQTSA